MQIYGAPHFDFHFYTVSDSVCSKAILPSDPQFATKAANFPASSFIPTGYVPPPGVPAANTIPVMGLHWSNTASPELNGKPFTSTFIFSSYDGRFIFIEPMITKAFLESHPNDDRCRAAAVEVGDAGLLPAELHGGVRCSNEGIPHRARVADEAELSRSEFADSPFAVPFFTDTER